MTYSSRTSFNEQKLSQNKEAVCEKLSTSTFIVCLKYTELKYNEMCCMNKIAIVI